MNNLLSIIIPIYNEKNTVGEVLKSLDALELPLEKELVIIDDSSDDGTYEKLVKLTEGKAGVKLLRHEKNMGKGVSVRDGFAHASGDIAIIQDADLEYDPKDIPKIIQPIIDGYADVVYGSRFVGSPRRALFFWHSLGNRFLTLLSNLFTNLNLTDMETCYKAFKKIVYKNLKLESASFTIEPEITAKIARTKQRIYEVPISYKGRSYWEGKKIHWKDGFKAIYAIIKHSLFSSISDDTGFKTLELISSSETYNKHIYSKISPFLGERILEVGSGIGNMTKYMLKKDFIMATDILDSYLHILKNSFENNPNISVDRLDLNDMDIERFQKHKIDTIVCLNVLEHIEDDQKVLERAYELLDKGGRLILLVPSGSWAFNRLDTNLGHFRRYSKNDLVFLAGKTKFSVKKIDYFNIIGLLGWYVSGKILRRKELSTGQMRLFNLTIPILKMEKLLGPPFGLSVIAMLEKD